MSVRVRADCSSPTRPSRPSKEFRPIYEGAVAQADKRKHDPKAVGKSTSFRTIEEAVDRGPALVGSSERVAEKILDYHESYGHDFQSVSVNHVLDFEQQKDTLRPICGRGYPAGEGRTVDDAVDLGRQRSGEGFHRRRLSGEV